MCFVVLESVGYFELYFKKGPQDLLLVNEVC